MNFYQSVIYLVLCSQGHSCLITDYSVVQVMEKSLNIFSSLGGVIKSILVLLSVHCMLMARRCPGLSPVFVTSCDDQITQKAAGQVL